MEKLQKFVSEKTDFLNNVLSKLGWTRDSLERNEMVQCPVDSNHWLPKSSLSCHIKTCSWVKEGYLKEDMEDQSLSSSFFYKDSKVVPVLLNKEEQAKILVGKGLWDRKCLVNPPPLPKTVERATVDLTVEQRLAIYDYCVQQSKSALSSAVKVEDLVYEFDKKNEEGDKPKSQMEIKAEERDYKRRRQTYRAKNVHITKKSYTEVMREVIENQISYLTEIRKSEHLNSSKSRSPARDRNDTEFSTYSDDEQYRKYRHDPSESTSYHQEKRNTRYSNHSDDDNYRSTKQDYGGENCKNDRQSKDIQGHSYLDYKSRKHSYKFKEYSQDRDSDHSDVLNRSKRHSRKSRDYSQDRDSDHPDVHNRSKRHSHKFRDHSQDRDSDHPDVSGYRSKRHSRKSRDYSQDRDSDHPDVSCYRSKRHSHKSTNHSQDRYSDHPDVSGYRSKRHSHESRQYSQDRDLNIKKERTSLVQQDEGNREYLGDSDDQLKYKKHSHKKSKKHKHDHSRSRSPSKKHKKSKHQKSIKIEPL